MAVGAEIHVVNLFGMSFNVTKRLKRRELPKPDKAIASTGSHQFAIAADSNGSLQRFHWTIHVNKKVVLNNSEDLIIKIYKVLRHIGFNAIHFMSKHS